MTDAPILLKQIVLVGAGNVGFHLAKALEKINHTPDWIWSRTLASAKETAACINSQYTTKITDLPSQADLYIVAVPDDFISEVAVQLSTHISSNAFVVHTSGATPTTVLAPYFSRCGVFYPLQTFSKKKVADFSHIPICVHAHKGTDLEQLTLLGQQISAKTYPISDEQRLRLHLAAIFVNNFTNYLQHISQTILLENQIPAFLLQPLLEETVEKLNEMTAAAAQTGPAVRGDESTIDRHLDLLAEHPDWQDLYRQFSTLIKHDLGKG